MPSLYIIAGPNGAGKTTFVRDFLRIDFAVLDFLNVDEMARGLSPLAPERAQREAGRTLLRLFARFLQEKRDFGLETTLSGRTYQQYLSRAQQLGYSIHLDYLVLPTVEDSIRRVAERVTKGGHDVPEATLRRRFPLGLQNLFRLYRPLLDSWALYHGHLVPPRQIVEGDREECYLLDQASIDEFNSLITDFRLKL